ncbi:MAG TPA: hypothetical protein VGI74_16155, partial [Streptosporangiaceae bacterium]
AASRAPRARALIDEVLTAPCCGQPGRPAGQCLGEPACNKAAFPTRKRSSPTTSHCPSAATHHPTVTPTQHRHDHRPDIPDRGRSRHLAQASKMTSRAALGPPGPGYAVQPGTQPE